MATFTFLRNTAFSQMFGCVIQTENCTVVLDGGTAEDKAQLRDFLSQHAGNRVDAWFFTHPHHDHIGSFVEILKSEPQIEIGQICHAFPSPEELMPQARTKKEKELITDFFALTEKRNCRRIKAGEVFSFDDVTFRVLRVYNPAITENFVNNSSTVYRIEGQKASFLILGDLGVDGGNEVMENCPLSLLQADYTQMAHHGQAGVTEEFYRYIKPKRCLWATAEWLWNNDAGEGFDTGPWFTVRTREWMEALGVSEHYVEKDGIHVFEF